MLPYSSWSADDVRILVASGPSETTASRQGWPQPLRHERTLARRPNRASARPPDALPLATGRSGRCSACGRLRRSAASARGAIRSRPARCGPCASDWFLMQVISGSAPRSWSDSPSSRFRSHGVVTLGTGCRHADARRLRKSERCPADAPRESRPELPAVNSKRASAVPPRDSNTGDQDDQPLD
jgi:hypothetical protein